MAITLNGTTGITQAGSSKADTYLDASGGNTATINGITPALSSQAQAQDGTDNTTQMTPLRVAQSQTLASGTVSGAAQLDIVLSSYTGYTSFEVLFFDLLAATSGTALRMRVSSDAGSSFISTATYRSFGSSLQSASTSVNAISHTTTATSFAISDTNIGNTTNKQALGSIIFSPRTNGFSFLSRLSNEQDSANAGVQQFANGTQPTVSVNAIRLFMSSGNISTMSWSLNGSR